MKLRSLCATTLVAVVGLSLVGGVSAHADTATEMTSTGRVIVGEGVINPPGTGGTSVDPEDPTKVLPEVPGVIEENPNTGAMMVTHVTNLDFGTIQTSTQEVSAYAAPISFTADGSTQKRGAVVQFGDIRTTAHGYTVTANLTQQFKGATSNGTLNGATITFTNPITETEAGSTGTAPTIASTVTVGETSGAQTVATATKDGTNGKGLWVVEYGQSSAYAGTNANATPGTDANSVQLKVPSYTAQSMKEDTYTAKVTWTITAAQ